MADTPSTQGTEDDVFTFSSDQSREFPLAPEGPHDVVVKRALFTMRDNTFAPEKGKQPTVSLMLESSKTYKDEVSGLDKNHTLFKTFKISDHEKSSMFAFFRDVMGTGVPLNDKKQIALRRKVVERDEGEPHTHLTQFEGLKFSVLVKHVKKEDGEGVRDKVDSVFASTEQKAANVSSFSAQA